MSKSKVSFGTSGDYTIVFIGDEPMGYIGIAKTCGAAIFIPKASAYFYTNEITAILNKMSEMDNCQKH